MDPKSSILAKLLHKQNNLLIVIQFYERLFFKTKQNKTKIIASKDGKYGVVCSNFKPKVQNANMHQNVTSIDNLQYD